MQELILICATIIICTLIITNMILKIKIGKNIDIIIDVQKIADKIKEIEEREENKND